MWSMQTQSLHLLNVVLSRQANVHIYTNLQAISFMWLELLVTRETSCVSCRQLLPRNSVGCVLVYFESNWNAHARTHFTHMVEQVATEGHVVTVNGGIDRQSNWPAVIASQFRQYLWTSGMRGWWEIDSKISGNSLRPASFTLLLTPVTPAYKSNFVPRNKYICSCRQLSFNKIKKEQKPTEAGGSPVVVSLGFFKVLFFIFW